MNPDSARDSRFIYWQRAKRLTAILLALWAVITFAVIFFARELSGLTLFGWPLPFYMAAQGLVVGYLLLIAFYAWAMERLDRMLKEHADRDA